MPRRWKSEALRLRASAAAAALIVSLAFASFCHARIVADGVLLTLTHGNAERKSADKTGSRGFCLKKTEAIAAELPIGSPPIRVTTQHATDRNMASTLNLTGYTLTFDDEFDNFSASANGAGTTYQTQFFWGQRYLPANGEQEYYSDSTTGTNPFALQNGALVVTAQPGSNPGGQPYTSGMIQTYHSFSQTYGYFEMRAKLPEGAGMWPAFWMLGENSGGEIDILEAFGAPNANGEGGSNQVSGGFHYSTSAGGWATVPADIYTGYHTYGLDWEPDYMTFYFDGQAIRKIPTPPDANQPMYLLANLAVGGSWPGAPAGETAQMDIDYIRAYAKTPGATPVTLQPISSPDGVDTTPVGATYANEPSTTTAQTPTLSVQSASGNEGAAIPLTISAAQAASNLAAANLTVGVSGLNGATLNHGTLNADGSYTLHASDLQGLALTPATEFTGHLSLTVTATDNEPSSSTTASSAAQTLAVTVNPVAEAPALSVQPASGNEGAAIPLTIAAAQAETDLAAANLTVTVAGLDGASLNHGTLNADGSYTLHAADLQGLALTPAPQFAGDLALTVTATDTEPSSGTTASSAAQTLDVSVAGSGSTTGGATAGTGTITLHVSGDDWVGHPGGGDPEFLVLVDGQQVGGVQTVTAVHNAGQWQDITVSGNFSSPHEVDVRFINDAYGGTDTQDINLYVDSIVVNGQHFDGAQAANNASGGYTDPTDPNAAIMVWDGTLAFDTAPPVDTPVEPRVKVYPGANGVAEGTSANETIFATGSGQTLIGGGGDDIFNIGTHSDAKIVETGSGVSQVTTTASSYTLPTGIDNLAGQGTGSQALTGNSGNNVIHGGNGSDTLIAGAGNDKLVVGTGANVLTGGTGDDSFVFSSPHDHGNVITDFAPNDDLLDLRPLMKAINYSGSNPVADHVLSFASDGHGGTVVSIDPDGTGPQAPHTLVTIHNVVPSMLHAGGNYLWH
jgi:beta-glucanase (GH16 family)